MTFDSCFKHLNLRCEASKKYMNKVFFKVRPFLKGAFNVFFMLNFFYSSSLLSVTLQSFVGPWPLFQFLNLLHSR
jgi:hypothetical protein